MSIYSDLSLNKYDPKVQKVFDLDSIYQSISNILSTTPGERIFNPEFGCELKDALFELITESTSLFIYNRITIAIGRWEPRVTLDHSKSTVIPDYNNYTYNVRLVFRVNGLGDNIFTYEATLKRR